MFQISFFNPDQNLQKTDPDVNLHFFLTNNGKFCTFILIKKVLKKQLFVTTVFIQEQKEMKKPVFWIIFYGSGTKFEYESGS